mgnify:FL=1
MGLGSIMFGIPYPLEDDRKYYDPNQLEFKFFFPLTEQIPLGLDYTDCEKPKLYVPHNSIGYTIAGATGTSWVTTSTDISTATLKVAKPEEIVGYFEIGPLQVGREKEPNIMQKLIYKLLGFNWKGKQ